VSEHAAALVIRSVDFSETSKVLTLFTRELGKLRVLAKGSRRLKSRFEVALDLLSVCSIAVRRKPTAELDLLTEAVLVERFDGLRRDLPALYAGYYVAEILDGLTQPADPHPSLYDLTVETLRQLAEGRDRLIWLCRYQLLLLVQLGYAPNLQSCAGCGAAVALASKMEYSIATGGIVCGECARLQPHGLVVQGGMVQALRLLGASEASKVSRLSLSRRARAELWNVTRASIEYLLGRRPRTATLIEL
jgi:DNA repair protein RecO (recombination protein O)